MKIIALLGLALIATAVVEGKNGDLKPINDGDDDDQGLDMSFPDKTFVGGQGQEDRHRCRRDWDCRRGYYCHRGRCIRTPRNCYRYRCRSNRDCPRGCKCERYWGGEDGGGGSGNNERHRYRCRPRH